MPSASARSRTPSAPGDEPPESPSRRRRIRGVCSAACGSRCREFWRHGSGCHCSASASPGSVRTRHRRRYARRAAQALRCPFRPDMGAEAAPHANAMETARLQHGPDYSSARYPRECGHYQQRPGRDKLQPQILRARTIASIFQTAHLQRKPAACRVRAELAPLPAAASCGRSAPTAPR